MSKSASPILDSPPRASINQVAVLAIVLLTYVMIVLDVSIVITALPKMRQELGFTAASLSWVQNAYTLVFGGLLLLGARAGDILGRRRVFTAGLALFTLASLSIGLAPSATWLLISRAIQGAGAAVLAPSTLALLSTHFQEGPERTRALGYYAAAAGASASAGLVLGGMFADWVSWRAGFFINVPIGIAVIVAARRYVTETPRREGGFDVAGALTSMVGMGLLVYGLVRSATAGWGDGGTVASVVGGSVLILCFFFIETRVRHPIMPLRLFADSTRVRAYLARMLFLGGMTGFWFFTTQLLQSVLGLSPARAGAAFLATTIPNFLSAMAVPKLSRRFGSGKLLGLGLILSIMGAVGLSLVSAGSSYLGGVAAPMAFIGLGQGLSLAPLTIAGVMGVSQDDAGAASGVVNAAHQLGGTLGLGILVVVFAAASRGTHDSGASLVHQIDSVFIACAAMLSLAFVVALPLIRARTRTV